MATLSEARSKELLAAHSVPFAPERQVTTSGEAVAAAEELGFPVVVKLGGDGIAHKTERGLVRLGLGDESAVAQAAEALLAAARPSDGEVHLLVAPMLSGTRELIAGLHHDPQFGMTVMLGIGGVLAEAIGDVVFRRVPLDQSEARQMVEDLATQKLLDEFRGEPAVVRDAVARVVVALSDAAMAHDDLVSADLNPLIIVEGSPVAVDALVELGERDDAAATSARRPPTAEQFAALFDPKGVVVAGASTHPGKFGFVSLHNLLAAGYQGNVYGTNLEAAPVLGIETFASPDDLPQGTADLVFVCTPASANPDLLRSCSAKGITAAFITSAGYGEAGDEGLAAQAELVELADELGMLLCGPNGQGVVSTPAKLCAQIVAPYPPAGHIGIASQSGNLVSSFMNYAVQTGVGVSRAVSAGNAAAVGVPDYLDHFADDPETRVGLAYVEGIGDGRAFAERVESVCERMPVVMVKGGVTPGGQRAAASHTGSLAADDTVFDGIARQIGVSRAATIEEAFDVAATFATQPLPNGNRVVVMTTVGGWGVMSADAISRGGVLDLITLPGDLHRAIDAKLPPRWSRNNPVDLAGGETRDTIPEVLELVAGHPGVDAVVYLGLGIQANQAKLMRTGGFYPDHGLERIVDYHERQDSRFAEAADEISTRLGKPILTATELAVADPTNPGPRAVRASGRLCYASGNRAITALEHLVRYASWRDRR